MSKKTTKNIDEKIGEFIQQIGSGACTLAQIALAIGSNNTTVKAYLEKIVYHQALPKVIIEKTEKAKVNMVISEGRVEYSTKERIKSILIEKNQPILDNSQDEKEENLLKTELLNPEVSKLE